MCGEGHVRGVRNASIILWRKTYRFSKCSWNMKTLWKAFNSLAHTEGFWLLQDFDFWVFIKLHFPSDAREAVVLLSQPEPEWNGCWQFQGVRKSSCGRGILPRAQGSCAVLPGWVCVRAGALRVLSGLWEDAQEIRFPPQTCLSSYS